MPLGENGALNESDSESVVCGEALMMMMIIVVMYDSDTEGVGWCSLQAAIWRALLAP
jgi:hypothetical protein